MMSKHTATGLFIVHSNGEVIVYTKEEWVAYGHMWENWWWRMMGTQAILKKIQLKR